jgi:hypothetical protein
MFLLIQYGKLLVRVLNILKIIWKIIPAIPGLFCRRKFAKTSPIGNAHWGVDPLIAASREKKAGKKFYFIFWFCF